jgi:hypothetical protein
MNKITEARILLQAVTTATKNRKMDDSFVKSYERATQILQEMESTAKGDNEFNETRRFSGRNISSQYSTQNLENSAGKNTDTVKSRTENNWSLTYARRILYESLDPAKSDPKVPPYQRGIDKWKGFILWREVNKESQVAGFSGYSGFILIGFFDTWSSWLAFNEGILFD